MYCRYFFNLLLLQSSKINMTTAALYTIMSMDDKSQLTKFSVFYCIVFFHTCHVFGN
jgi:hypothetical protein